MARIKKIICCLMLLSVGCLFTGCHTVKGAGEDVERGGEKIQNAAERIM